MCLASKKNKGEATILGVHNKRAHPYIHGFLITALSPFGLNRPDFSTVSGDQSQHGVYVASL